MLRRHALPGTAATIRLDNPTRQPAGTFDGIFLTGITAVALSACLA